MVLTVSSEQFLSPNNIKVLGRQLYTVSGCHTFFLCQIQVSSVTDHVGVQDSGTKTADFDDDDGGGLVSE